MTEAVLIAVETIEYGFIAWATGFAGGALIASFKKLFFTASG